MAGVDVDGRVGRENERRASRNWLFRQNQTDGIAGRNMDRTRIGMPQAICMGNTNSGHTFRGDSHALAMWISHCERAGGSSKRLGRTPLVARNSPQAVANAFRREQLL